MLNPRQKKSLETLFSQSDIALDQEGWAYLRRLLNGWSAIRPITLTRPQSGPGFELSWIEEHHEEPSKKNANTDSGSELRHHVLRIDHDGASMTRDKHPGTDITSLKELLGQKTRTENVANADIFSFVNLFHCRKTVHSLTRMIIDSLAMSGDLSASSINTPGDMTLFKNSLQTILARGEKVRRIQAVRKMTRLLDPDQLRIMRATGSADLKTLQWLNNSGDEVINKYRLQAAQSYPLFLGIMTGKHIVGSTSHYILMRQMHKSSRAHAEEESKRYDAFVQKNSDLNKAINNATPIADLIGQSLSHEFTVSEKTIRNLGRIKSKPEMDYKTFIKAMPYLDQVDHTWHPKTPDDLAAYLTCVKCAEAFVTIRGSNVINTLKNTGGKWIEWAAKFGSAQDILDIKDWLDEVHKIALLPRVLSLAPLPAVKQLLDTKRERRLNTFPQIQRPSPIAYEARLISGLLDGVTDMELLACSKRWHEQGEGYAARKCTLAFTELKNIEHWQALSVPVTSPQGILMTPLSSRTELTIEGAEAGHCVGWNGYSEQCLTGSDHIISLSENGKRLSTLQLREVFNNAGQVTGLKKIQHQGVKRTSITDPESRAATWYARELFNNESLTPDWEAMEKARAANRLVEAKGGISALIGFDITQDGNCNTAFEAIRSYLPNRYRNMTYESFIAAPHLVELFSFENTELYNGLLQHNLIKPSRQKPVVPVPEAVVPAPQANDNKPGFFQALRRVFA